MAAALKAAFAAKAAQDEVRLRGRQPVPGLRLTACGIGKPGQQIRQLLGLAGPKFGN